MGNKTLKPGPLSWVERENTFNVVSGIVDMLDIVAINELLEGTGKDIDNLFNVLIEETNSVVNLGAKNLNSSELDYLPSLKHGYEHYLRVSNLNYFISSCLPGFDQSWHCFGEGLEVRMFDGSIKEVQDIEVGDEVMGPDSLPRKVLKLYRGQAPLYRINNTGNVDSYVVNNKHDILLWDKKGKLHKKKAWEIPKRPEKNKWTSWWHEEYSQRIVGYEKETYKFKFDPYFLGLWLGDGTLGSQEITTNDFETLEYLQKLGDILGLDLRDAKDGYMHYSLVKRPLTGKTNILRDFLRELGVFTDKKIPEETFSSSIEERLRLLAGFIDSDGNFSNNVFTCSGISEKLLRGVQNLAYSLGFRATFKETNYFNSTVGRPHQMFTVCISGDIYKIPTKIERKKSKIEYKKSKASRDWRRSNIKSVDLLGFGEYYGFELDGDHTFLSKNGMIMSNCLEWGQLIQMYKYLCVIAARDHSKSYMFSFANILWGMYRYERPTQLYVPSLEITLCKETMLITNEFSLAKRLLKLVKAEIEVNPILQERLLPDSRAAGWGETALTTKNGADFTLSSFHSSNRGPHPGRIVVDDFLDKSALYSKVQREKFKEVFTAEIMNMILPQGQVLVVGCVEKTTLVLTKDSGFRTVGSFNQTDDFKKKSLQTLKVKLLSQNEWSETSKFFVNGVVETNKITTKGGFELECSQIHPLWKMGEDGVSFWCESRALKIGDWIELKGFDGEFGQDISLKEFKNQNRDFRQNILNLPDTFDKDLAYFVGLFIAEGNYYYDDRHRLAGLQISSGDLEIEAFLFSLTKYGIEFKSYEKFTYTVYNKNLTSLFLFLGFNLEKASKKVIPEKLLRCKKEILTEILKGLFDGDGTCGIDKTGCLSLQYYSASEKLIKTLQSLLLMGWDIFTYVSVNKKIRGNFGEWVLTFQKTDAAKFLKDIGFRLTRKNLTEFKIPKKLDFIPHQNPLLKIINKKFERSQLKGIKPYVTSTKSQKSSEYICRKALQRVVSRSEKTGFWCEELSVLKSSLKKTSYWTKIKNIEKGSAETVDFVIPTGHNFITNCISSHNTPFHEKDIYNDLKEDSNWKVFEYPAIFPDGRILYDGRYNYEALVSKRKSLGSLIFSREILVKPITDNVSIFPYSILEIAFINMQSLSMVQNRQSYPIKFKKIAVGCDFALSANVGADDTVYTVVGLDSLEQIHLIHASILHGAGFNEQIINLQRICNDFQPEVVVMETNGFQQVMAQNAKDRGIQNIIEFNTTGFNKKDLYEGVPSLAIMFETGTMKFPRGDEKSKQMTDMYCSQLNSMAFDDDRGKLESVSEHDDCVMSLFFGVKGLKMVNSEFRVSMIDTEY